MNDSKEKEKIYNKKEQDRIKKNNNENKKILKNRQRW